MSKKIQLPTWQKNRFRHRDVFFMDGDRFFVAIWAKNEEGKWGWCYHTVRADCDGENFGLRYDESGESADITWWDVDRYIKLSAYGPMTEKQMEGVS